MAAHYERESMKLKPDNVPWWKAALVAFLVLAVLKALLLP